MTTIYWGGMGVGRDTDDRHGQGFALDSHGAETNAGHIDVQADWGRPTSAADAEAGRKTWPAGMQPYSGSTSTPMPAASSTTSTISWPARPPTPPKPSSIGDRSFIAHPDHPDASLRSCHQDHIHCEIDH